MLASLCLAVDVEYKLATSVSDPSSSSLVETVFGGVGGLIGGIGMLTGYPFAYDWL